MADEEKPVYFEVAFSNQLIAEILAAHALRAMNAETSLAPGALQGVTYTTAITPRGFRLRLKRLPA